MQVLSWVAKWRHALIWWSPGDPLGWTWPWIGQRQSSVQKAYFDLNNPPGKEYVVFFLFCVVSSFSPRASERRVLLIVGVCETSSHLHIFSSSHLLIFTYLPIFSSSHPHIFTCVHLHIFSSSHPHILSCSLALLLPPSFLFLSWRRGAVPTRRHEMQPFRAKWCSIAKNWNNIAFSGFRSQRFRTKWGSIAKNWSKIAICKCPAQPFRTKWGSITKNWSKIAICKVWIRIRRNPFARNEVRSPKNWGKIAICNPFARNEVRSPWGKIAISGVQSQPFRTKWGWIAKNCGKIAICKAYGKPFRTKWGSIAKNWGKIAMSWVRSLCVCESVCV